MPELKSFPKKKFDISIKLPFCFKWPQFAAIGLGAAERLVCSNDLFLIQLRIFWRKKIYVRVTQWFMAMKKPFPFHYTQLFRLLDVGGLLISLDESLMSLPSF